MVNTNMKKYLSYHYVLLGIFCCVSSFSAVANGLQDKERVIFLGDSITRMGDSPGGYVSLVRGAVKRSHPGQGIEIIGAGIGGNKVPDLLKRLDRDVLSKKPTRVMIYIGINDVWHWERPHPVTKQKREGTTAEAYEAGLRELVARITGVGAKVILCTPTVIGEQVKPEDPSYKRLEQYSTIVRTVASDTGSQLLNLRKVFITHLKENNPDNVSKGILTKDGVHLNDAGNQLIAKQVCGALKVPYAKADKTDEVVAGVQKSGLDLYLCIGQSNMAGRAPIPKDATGDIKNAFLLNDQGEWAPASNPMNRYSTVRKGLDAQKLSPSYSFALRMLETNPDVPLGLIVNAKGGTKIDAWQKGSLFYDEAVMRTKAALQSGEIKGVIWHQGEGNAEDTEYLAKLIKLVESLRSDLNAPELPFVVGQINGIPLINNQLAQLPEKMTNTACASSDGLVAQDKWHFNTESQLELGRRYADEMLKLQK